MSLEWQWFEVDFTLNFITLICYQQLKIITDIYTIDNFADSSLNYIPYIFKSLIIIISLSMIEQFPPQQLDQALCQIVEPKIIQIQAVPNNLIESEQLVNQGMHQIDQIQLPHQNAQQQVQLSQLQLVNIQKDHQLPQYFSHPFIYDIQQAPCKWNKSIKSERKGRFSPEQQRVVSNAVGQFLATNQITYDEFIVILNKQNIINTLLKKLNFFGMFSNILPNRSSASCYRFIKRTFNSKNRKGKWTKEEEAKLLKFIKKYGKDWTLIADALNRTSDNVYDKFKSLGAENAQKRLKNGWTLRQLVTLLTSIEQRSDYHFVNADIKREFEQERFHNTYDKLDHHRRKYNSFSFKFHNIDLLLKYVTNNIRLVNLDSIAWSSVSRKVKSRSLIDCKNMFMQILEIVFRQMSHECEKDIISFIEGQKVERQNLIDWSHWKHSDIPIQQAKNRLYFLKKSVPNKSKKEFATILQEIKRKIVKQSLQPQS